MGKHSKGALNALIPLFSKLSDSDARELAFNMTASINEAIYGNRTVMSLPEAIRNPEIDKIAAAISIQPRSTSIPWMAYSLSRVGEFDMPMESAIKSILATIPDEYSMSQAAPADFISPYGGSLIKHLAEMISNTRESLIVVNPYWNTSGLKLLSRQIKKGGRVNGGRARILTQSELDGVNSEGCNYFKWMLRNRGFDVEHWTPKKLSDGNYPLVHAKVVISDKSKAYLGSANLTESGLDKSIEIGVSIRGAVARNLHLWFEHLVSNFEMQ